jgi:hypothetical protein
MQAMFCLSASRVAAKERPSNDDRLCIGGGSDMRDMWTYREDVAMKPAVDLTGYKIEALDGDIGKVDESTADTGKSFVVVDTGPWIFGRKVLLPAQTIHRIDLDEQKVFVDRTKEEIKNAPEFDPERGIDPTYQDEVGGYYGRYYS